MKPAPAAPEMYRVNPDTIALVLLDKLISGIDQAERPDMNNILWIKFPGPDLLRIDEHMIGTAQVNNAVPTTAHAFQPRMSARNQRMIQYHHIIREAPNRNHRR